MTYTVQPAAGVQTGTVITNTATIVFDNNEPIETAAVWNTIDAGAPTSSAVALPAFSSTNFPVCWIGTDDTGGSGVQGYDLYVSDNSGPYQLWLANIPDNCAVYSGQSSHTYAFYSLGRDNVGNLESAPTVPDAITTVSNTPPVIEPVTNQFVVVGNQLVITNIASDPDGVTFSLGAGAPAGASITTNGVFRWAPSCTQGSTTNEIIVCATDHGTPPASNCIMFIVTVPECIEASLGNTNVLTGTTSSVPVRLLSTTELTNMGFTVVYPPERFTNLTINVNAPEILTQWLSWVGPGQLKVSFTLASNTVLHGPTNVGQLGFSALANQHSAFVPLPLVDVTGTKPGGAPVGNAYGQAGRVVVVGNEPLLEALLNTNRDVTLLLYGIPGTTNEIFSSGDLSTPGSWTNFSTVPLTNLFEFINVNDATNGMMFFRARRQ